MRKTIALCLTMMLVIALSSSAFAVISSPVLTVKIAASPETVDGRDTLVVNWYVTAKTTNIELRGSSGLRLAYDNTVLELVRFSGTGEDYTITETLNGMPSASRLGAYEGAFTDVRASRSSNADIGYVTIEVGHPEYTLNCEPDVEQILISIRLAYRDEKSQSDLKSDSIRLMTQEEMESSAQPAAVNLSVVSTGTNTEYAYRSRTIEDTLNVPEIIIPYTTSNESEFHETPDGDISEINANKQSESVNSNEPDETPESKESGNSIYNSAEPDISNDTNNPGNTSENEPYEATTYGVVYSDFDKVPDWAKTAVEFVGARDFVVGLDGDVFGPTVKVTRGMFTATLMKAYGVKIDAESTDNFSDVDNKKAYAPYLATAKKYGIAAGIGNNKFAPEQHVTRQEMFVLLYRTLQNIGKLPKKSENGKTLLDFTDAGDVADWAADAMETLLQAGMIAGTGNNELSPKLLSDRSTMAQMIYNLLAKEEYHK